MLTEMTHLELMTYSADSAEGMEHSELSTTISSQRPLGSKDGTETRRRRRSGKVWVLQGAGPAGPHIRHQTLGQVEGKGVQHAQLMHALQALQVIGFDAKLIPMF